MHVRPAPLLILHRQSIFEGLLYTHLAEGWRRQGIASRYRPGQGLCCQKANNQASSSRLQQLSSTFLLQQRHFVASGRSRQEASSSSAGTQVQTLFEGNRADLAHNALFNSDRLSLADPIGAGPVKSLREDPKYYEDIPRSYEEMRTKLEVLQSPTSKSRYSQRLKKYMQESLSIFKVNVESGHSLLERLEILRSSIDRLYHAWLMSTKLFKDPSRINLHLKIARKLASFGDFCRRIGADRHSVFVLQARVGRHLAGVLDFTEMQLQSASVEDESVRFILHCLRSRSYSLQDDEENARQLIADLLSRREEWFNQFEKVQKEQIGSRTRLASYPQLENLVDALGSLLQITLDCSRGKTRGERHDLAVEVFNWLILQPSSFLFNSFLFNAVAFRLNIIVGHLDNALAYLQETVKRVDQQTKDTLTGAVCICLLRQGAILPAYNLFRWSRDIHIPLQESLLRQLLRHFTAEKEYLMAATIVEELVEKREGRHLSIASYRTIANYYAMIHEDHNVDKMLKTIDTQANTMERTTVEKFAFDCRLLCYSNKGDVQSTSKLVEDRYDMRIGPGEVPADGLLYPDYEVHSRLVQAYLNNNQISEAESMLHRMVLFGHRPSTMLLSATMEYYAKIDDITSTLSIFKQMLDAKISMNVQVYTTLIARFAKRADADGAEAVMKAMKDNKVSPDRVAYTALLNAYIEAGRWQQAIDVFEWMKNHHNHKLQPSTAAYNSIIKACVRRSIPVQQVYDIFKEMLKKGYEPSRETYALILQSAADAGMMELAEDIFSSIEDQLGDRYGTKKKRGADVYNFTTMIQGYLRQNLLQSAKAYAGEMRDRGYKGTGVLWNILAKVYIADDTSSKLQASRELIGNATFDKANEYVTAYAPLTHALGKRALPEEIEGVFQSLNEKKSDIPIPLWVNLLDAFRQEDNVEGALEIWNVIFDKASSYLINKGALAVAETFSSTLHATSDASANLDSSRSNLLCLPLSIIIDVLAKHGKYERIASEWIRCRKGGFAFNSHNWNHLCVSFLQAGRVQDSLNIIERVLNRLPPSKEWHEIDREEIKKQYIELKSIEASSSTEKNEGEEMEKVDSSLQSPNRRFQARHRDDRTTLNPIIGDDLHADEEGNPKDSSSHSGTLQQLNAKEEKKDNEDILEQLRFDVMLSEVHSPWFAHLETMSQLSKTIRSLQDRGGIIQTGIDTFASITELFQRYPRVKELLDLYERKMEQKKEDQARSMPFRRGSYRTSRQY